MRICERGARAGSREQGAGLPGLQCPAAGLSWELFVITEQLGLCGLGLSFRVSVLCPLPHGPSAGTS